MQTNINEIIATKAVDPYDDGYVFRDAVQEHSNEITYVLKDEEVDKDFASIASSDEEEKQEADEDIFKVT